MLIELNTEIREIFITLHVTCTERKKIEYKMSNIDTL